MDKKIVIAEGNKKKGSNIIVELNQMILGNNIDSQEYLKALINMREFYTRGILHE